ncbi:hypothetical protein FPZ24_16865 [Sphingomonas panacisoli]|uniref:Terminase n=1 Tax=Sphingomonas panacisoli TaxID=1813879 RepID=A0A5B8LL46_9SPHN|nr:hypothetical protein [Sphingomonas panacisoli]QDZ08938.1 hypothetical protein FPZ24_16865 [Sphingomonas panacisoli]
MTDSSDPRQLAPGNALAVTDLDDTEFDAPEPYDPADYRWVPVRRTPRYDGWTEEKQRRFIETLADTGLVGAAAKAVGMSRNSAYKLRRSGHGGAFARAWDAARHHAGGLIEDIAFERAIEGVEHEVYNDCGEVVGARLVHDNRLLKWLLSHLKADRYGAARGRDAQAGGAVVDATPAPAPALSVEDSLRAMEPALPAPPEHLLTPDEFADALEDADTADGVLPHYDSEQRRPRTDAELAADEHQARMARGEAAIAKRDAGQELTQEEFADECYWYDPVGNKPRQRRSR